jgi:y4mF family transcriptional regulator
MDIGKRIRELRKAAKITQPELSERAGVGLRFIRELERGKPTVRLDKVKQVLEFFGYHLEVVKNERVQVQESSCLF